jgi:hypothetical protein
MKKKNNAEINAVSHTIQGQLIKCSIISTEQICIRVLIFQPAAQITLKSNNVAKLVGTDNFFCKLHKPSTSWHHTENFHYFS